MTYYKAPTLCITTPRAIARATCAAKNANICFEDIEQEFLANGMVVSTPTFYALMQAYDFGHCTAWYIYLYAGDTKGMLQLFDMVPFKSDYVGFARRKNNVDLPVRWYKWDALKNKIKRTTLWEAQ